MPEYLICVYRIASASPYYLYQAMSHVLAGDACPDLYIAAKTQAASIDELKEIVVKARWMAFERFGFAFADQVPKDEYRTYLFSPFLRKIPADFPEYPDHLYQGVPSTPEFYTEIHNGWEYQDADFMIMLPEDAINKWNQPNVAAALLLYEQWLLSEDAQKFTPENHECFFLRTCLELNQAVSGILSANTVETDKKQAPPKHLSRRYKKDSDRLLAMDAAVQIILEAMFANAPFPVLTEVADQLFKDGFAINPKTFNKRLSEEPVIQALRSQAKKRPKVTTGKAYEKWREELMKTLARFRDPILQSDTAGLEEPKKVSSSRKPDGAKKKEENENNSTTKT